MKKKNRLLKYFLLGFIGGLILAVFNIDLNFMSLIYLFLGVIFILTMYHNVITIKIQSLFNKYKKNETLDLNELEEYILKLNIDYLKQYALVNLNALYSNRDNHEKALEVIKKVDLKFLNKPFKALYYNNFAYELFKNDKIEEAKDVLKKSKDLLNKYINNKKLGAAFKDTIEQIEKAK
jgi:tetratricopeptide (TPR) repeat protein